MTEILYLVSYLVTALFVLYRDFSTTGKTDGLRVGIALSGYVMVCGFLSIRNHLDAQALVGMLILLLAAAGIAYTLKLRLGRPDRAEALETEQDEIEQSVYARLEPDPAWSSPDRNERRIRQEQKGKSSPWIIVAIVVISFNLIAGFYFQVILPQQTTNAIANAPLLNAANLSTIANQHKLCKCELFTNSQSLSKVQKVAYLRLYSRESSKYRGRISYRWQDRNQTPEVLTLHSADRKIQIMVDGNDLDRSFLEVFFEDCGKDRAKAPVPKEWLKVLDDNDKKYLVKGLPADHSLTCVGIVEQNEDGLWFRPFAYKHNDHGVIASVLTSDKLNTYLHIHPTFGPELNELTGADSPYETEPRLN